MESVGVTRDRARLLGCNQCCKDLAGRSRWVCGLVKRCRTSRVTRGEAGPIPECVGASRVGGGHARARSRNVHGRSEVRERGEGVIRPVAPVGACWLRLATRLAVVVGKGGGSDDSWQASRLEPAG